MITIMVWIRQILVNNYIPNSRGRTENLDIEVWLITYLLVIINHWILDRDVKYFEDGWGKIFDFYLPSPYLVCFVSVMQNQNSNKEIQVILPVCVQPSHQLGEFPKTGYWVNENTSRQYTHKPHGSQTSIISPLSFPTRKTPVLTMLVVGALDNLIRFWVDVQVSNPQIKPISPLFPGE